MMENSGRTDNTAEEKLKGSGRHINVKVNFIKFGKILQDDYISSAHFIYL